jgi:two-component system CheB/CheR fusion protein
VALPATGTAAQRTIDPWPRTAAVICATAIAYLITAKLGLRLAFVAEQVTVVWPPTGIALAALVLFGRNVWPGIALGAFLANLTAHTPVLVAAGITAGNTAEAIVGAWMLERLGFRTQLDRLRDVLALIGVAALGSTMISATVGVMSLCLGGMEPWGRFWSLWWTWWLGDAIGDLVIAPLLLVWRRAQISRRVLFGVAPPPLVTALVALALFAGPPAMGLRSYPLHYTIFPLIVWAALRARQLGTTVVTVAASVIAIWSTANGLGPFAMTTTHESLIMLQLFMGVAAATGLLLSAAILERDSALAQRARDCAALELSEGRLRMALDAGRLGVWDWDVGTGVIQWSENLASIHGLAPGSFSGTFDGFRALVHPDDRGRVDAAIRGAMEGGGDYGVEFRNVWPDGSLHWIAAKGRVVFDPEKRAVRMLGTASEITERRHLEEELRQRAQALADADRHKDEFLAMLAHELRNPLAPLSTSLHLIRSASGGRERFFEIAERQVQHLVRLVDDLLDVSRISRGMIELRKEPLWLADVVHHAVELTQPAIASRNHRLTVSLPSEPVRLEADPVRLAQVIANLLSNAAKYTLAEGSIWLTAETVANQLTLRVRDSGVGLAPELIPKIFDLFVQGDTSIDRARGGLGIGLTLVRGLVELHGGQVEARSAGVGKGSEFIVHLPTMATRLQAPLKPGADDRNQPQRPLRILIVEDNRDAAESLATMLKLWGHEVTTSHDGIAAVRAAQAAVPEVVISDLGLPGMDGYELARALRQQPAFGQVVFVALSGYGRDEDRQRSLDAGFDHHHVKPLDIGWLFDLLGRVSGSRTDQATIRLH